MKIQLEGAADSYVGDNLVKRGSEIYYVSTSSTTLLTVISKYGELRGRGR